MESEYSKTITTYKVLYANLQYHLPSRNDVLGEILQNRTADQRHFILLNAVALQLFSVDNDRLLKFEWNRAMGILMNPANMQWILNLNSMEPTFLPTLWEAVYAGVASTQGNQQGVLNASSPTMNIDAPGVQPVLSQNVVNNQGAQQDVQDSTVGVPVPTANPGTLVISPQILQTNDSIAQGQQRALQNIQTGIPMQNAGQMSMAPTLSPAKKMPGQASKTPTLNPSRITQKGATAKSGKPTGDQKADPNQAPTANGKSSPKAQALREKKKNRILTADEIRRTLVGAKARGLPGGWTVEWDNQHGQRIWISPDGSKICRSFGAAIAWSTEMGLTSVEKLPHRVLTKKEVAAAMKEAEAKGLTGWTVDWDDKFQRRVWLSPDGSKRCKGITEALVASVKMGLVPAEKLPAKYAQDRVLTESEIEVAMKAAKAEGLPDGWTVEWDTKHNQKVWVSPDGLRRCYSVPQAIGYSARLGLTEHAVMTQDEMETTLRKAKAKGLPDGWKVELSNSSQKLWISPCGTRRCLSVPEALAVSVKLGLLSANRMPMRVLTPIEVAKAIREAKEKGLADGWTVAWDNRSNRRVFISPDGKKKCKGITEALVVSVKLGLTSPDRINSKYLNRTLTQEEIDDALKLAKARGLPEGWKVVWDRKKNRKSWISPDGTKKCLNIPEALTMSIKLGLISRDQLPAQFSEEGKVLNHDEVKAALKEVKNNGLPPGWNCMTTPIGRKKWVYRKGGTIMKRVDSLRKAVIWSASMGLLYFKVRGYDKTEQRFLRPEEQIEKTRTKPPQASPSAKAISKTPAGYNPGVLAPPAMAFAQLNLPSGTMQSPMMTVPQPITEYQGAMPPNAITFAQPHLGYRGYPGAMPGNRTATAQPTVVQSPQGTKAKMEKVTIKTKRKAKEANKNGKIPRTPSRNKRQRISAPVPDVATSCTTTTTNSTRSPTGQKEEMRDAMLAYGLEAAIAKLM